jgi:hypothetical protein
MSWFTICNQGLVYRFNLAGLVDGADRFRSTSVAAGAFFMTGFTI